MDNDYEDKYWYLDPSRNPEMTSDIDLTKPRKAYSVSGNHFGQFVICVDRPGPIHYFQGMLVGFNCLVETLHIASDDPEDYMAVSNPDMRLLSMKLMQHEVKNLNFTEIYFPVNCTSRSDILIHTLQFNNCGSIPAALNYFLN